MDIGSVFSRIATVQPKRILVIEDDPDIARLHQLDLGDAGYEVVTAYSGVLGLIAAREQDFDAVVLDLGLPDYDGSQIIKRLRVNSTLPIIVVSARDDTAERVRLLQQGASDYLVKPFDARELLARLQAKLRHHCGHIRSAGPLLLDMEQFTVTYMNVEVPLTLTEMKVLQVLLDEPGKLMTREEIARNVWQDGGAPSSNAVAVHVGHIREKFREIGAYRVIRTVQSIGYAIRELRAS